MRINIKKTFKKYNPHIFRGLSLKYIFGTVVVGLFVTTPLLSGVANAVSYNLISSRSITMSNSTASATSVKFSVSFIPFTTSETIGGIVVDFCGNDPIIGDSCTTTAATDANVTSSPTTSGAPTGFSTATGSWVAGVGASPYNTFNFTNSTAQTGSATANTPITFTITSGVNPTNTNATFFARILTYTTAAGATGYTSTSPGAPQDAGGIALSTANNVVITAKVQEQITFCIYESALVSSGASAAAGDGGNCSGTGSTVTLGNANGVLSAAGPYVDLGTHYDIQTNALHGAAIVFSGAPLTSGANVIEYGTLSGTGAVAATGYPTNGTPGTNQQFGLCSYAVSGTTANLTIASTYNFNSNCSTVTQSAQYASTGGAGTADFGFNIASAATASNPYGDTLATFPSAGAYAVGDIAFIGNITNTTPAGIYTTTLKFIATGTY